MAVPKKKSTSTIKKEKATNEGNMAEGVLGAAIVAKIVERQPNGVIGKIQASHVMKVLKIMQKAPATKQGTTKTQVKVDVGGVAKDRVVFFLNLGMITMRELKIMDLNALKRLAESAASYANSPRIAAMAAAMYQNNIGNKLEIDVDGISSNTSTKSDIEVKTDKYVFDKISLKAGSMKTGHTLGQVGGNSWGSILRLFNEGTNERTKKAEVGMLLPINKKTTEDLYMKLLTPKPTFETVAKAVRMAYEMAAKSFNLQAQQVLAHNVFKFLQFHSSRGDTDVKIVKLHLSTHKTLDPLRLEQALKNVKLIKALVRLDAQWPILLIYDASGEVPTTIYSPSVIFSITVKIDSRQMGYIYHLVKEGARFESLIEEK